MSSGSYEHLIGRRIARLAASVAVSALAYGLLAVSAQAAEPTIATDGASATGSTYAMVEGNGSPGGHATTVHADYALASESWCTSHGVEGTPRETGPKSLGSGNVEISEIHVELSGLEPGSKYCAELVAENDEGTAYGGQVYVSTPVRPAVKAESASQITASDATLEATIEPKGPEATTYEFFLEAPSCASYGIGYCEASGGMPIFKGSLPAGSGTKTVSVDIASVWHKLTANTLYGYRVVATRGIAEGFGQLKTFATLPLPSIESLSLSHLTSTDATLEAQIDTEGLETSYQFRLESGCLWPRECLAIAVYPLPSGKLLGSFVDQSVSLDLNSAGVTLKPGVEYAYSVTATSAAGDVTGGEQRFTTPEDVAQPPSNTTTPSDDASSSDSGSQGSGSPASQPTTSTGTTSHSIPDLVPGKHHAKHKRRRHKHHLSKATRHKRRLKAR